jgi:hypothetical protein
MPTIGKAENPRKIIGFQPSNFGEAAVLENFGATNCANVRRRWHGWHTREKFSPPIKRRLRTGQTIGGETSLLNQCAETGITY